MTLTLTSVPVRVHKDDWLRRRFRELRQAERVSLRQAGEYMGVSAAAISRWERGEPSLGEWRVYLAMDWMEERRLAR